MYDAVIRNGTIIDGTGNAAYQADLAIVADKIVEIARDGALEAARRTIDATGLIVAPGFFDMHSHSDLTLYTMGSAQSSLYQGVTSEVVGNCGFSGFPVAAERAPMLEAYLGGIGYDQSYRLPWNDFAGYAASLEANGVGVNVVPLVGHGSIRIAAMGYDAREATEAERKHMAELLQQALDQGVFGMSSGLVYPPGINSPAWELEQLCALVARAGALYTTHLRGDGLRAGPTLVESLDEALQVARATGVSLQVSHAAAKFPNDGAADEMVEKMRRARQEGLEVGCDVHPYMAAMTFLASLMPPWFFEGGAKEARARLQDESARARIRKDLAQQFNHLGWDAFWSRTEAILEDTSSPFNRTRFSKLARDHGKDPCDVLMDLLVQQGEDFFKPVVLHWIYSPEDTLKTFLWDQTMIGADAVSTSLEARRELMSLHPRAWGTFPSAVKRFVTQGGYVSMEEMVRRMTSLPAQKVGIRDRGILAVGMKADIVVFDRDRFADMATYENPRQYAQGVVWVFVNGVAALAFGRHTDNRAGQVLKRTMVKDT